MSTIAGLLILAGRIIFSIYFVAVAGPFHLMQPDIPGGMAKQQRFPAPALARWPAGVWLVAAGLSIALGIFPDIGALMVAVFVTIAAAYFHRFWELEDQDQQMMQMQLFFRNVTFLGAALILFTYFALSGDALRFAITGPAIDLR